MLNFRGKRSLVVVGENINNLKDYLNGRLPVLLIDKTIHTIYRDIFRDFEKFEIKGEENSKELEGLKDIYRWLLNKGIDRAGILIGVGGGVICDISGFISSTYMRGISFGFVPSTLLAQVDAGIGGKNGVNLNGYKNIIGTINQPEFVLCDLDILGSLTDKEFLSGMGEVIKHAIIGSPELFKFLMESKDSIMRRQRDSLFKIITKSIEVKKSIVELDEFESGERKKLNFGHTFGHVIEKEMGLAHGLSVCIGMKIALNVSYRMGILEKEVMNRAIELIEKYCPHKVKGLPLDKLLRGILKDKKKNNDRIDFVGLKDLGLPVILDIHLSEMEELLKVVMEKQGIL